jgi:hypothetical protein
MQFGPLQPLILSFGTNRTYTVQYVTIERGGERFARKCMLLAELADS